MQTVKVQSLLRICFFQLPIKEKQSIEDDIFSHPMQHVSLLQKSGTNHSVGGENDWHNKCRILMNLLVSTYIFIGHKGRVLHITLSPDQRKPFSVAVDGMSCL